MAWDSFDNLMRKNATPPKFTRGVSSMTSTAIARRRVHTFFDMVVFN